MITGTRLKELRTKCKMSQPELAAKLGVSTSCVAMWESNKREIGQDNLIAITKLFDVSSDYLLGLKYNDIDMIFYNQVKDLKQDQKIELIKYASYLRSK